MAESKKRKTARERLTSLLGDFPQGFNAGMLAGIPGWAGDIGYLLQEYPRALLTDTPLRPPVEYAGTTDSIAKAAGYEIPGTISGQLGAAVGGLLSPGPGDLAKFAPLLGAIPFWHGSPHKFDAFDLSKMGTGEGAQAYGWGAYGAENKKVAQEYFDKLGEIATYVDGEKLTDPMGSPRVMAVEYLKNSPSPEYAKDYAAMMHKAGLWKNNPEQYRAVISAIDEFAGKPVDSRIEGNLYRGEYAWTDPAKESATPLTGEDLLQWDKPLSEQPQAVRNAIERAMEDKTLDDYSRTVLKKGGVGAAMYEALRVDDNLGATPEATSRYLHSIGIPGIRYLDGQSRDGGSGTYNYVMFDDKGIKLLERNGKPIGGLLGPAMSEPPSKGMLGYDTDMKVPAKPYQPIRASEVDGVAETLVSRLKELGIVPEGVNGSSTSTGRSVYIPITVRPSAAAEPNWRRDGRIPDYVWNTEIRVSDHGTGAQRTGNYLHVNSQEDVEDVIAKIQHQVAGLNDKVLQAQKSIDLTPNRAARRASQKAARGLLNP